MFLFSIFLIIFDGNFFITNFYEWNFMRPYLFTKERFHCLLPSWENPNRFWYNRWQQRTREQGKRNFLTLVDRFSKIK